MKVFVTCIWREENYFEVLGVSHSSAGAARIYDEYIEGMADGDADEAAYCRERDPVEYQEHEVEV